MGGMHQMFLNDIREKKDVRALFDKYHMDPRDEAWKKLALPELCRAFLNGVREKKDVRELFDRYQIDPEDEAWRTFPKPELQKMLMDAISSKKDMAHICGLVEKYPGIDPNYSKK